MPSIGSKNDLRIFASASLGPSICLALKDFTAGDGDSIILIYEPGAAEAWRRIELPFDVVDVTCTPDELRTRSNYMALASTGEAIFLFDPPEPERINPEGTFQVVAPGKGMLSAFENIRGELFALGRGGQVYRRDASWMPLSSTFPMEADATDHVSFVAGGAYGDPDGLCFGGFATPQLENFDEVADLLLSDPDSFLDRIDNEVRPIYGTLWLFESGQWIKMEMPTSAEITSFLRRDSGHLFFSTDQGFVGRIISVSQIEEAYSWSDRRKVVRLFVWDGRFIVLLGNEIVALDVDHKTEDSLPVSRGFDDLCNLHPVGQHVWLVDGRGLARWNGADWDEVTIPQRLLR